MFRHTKLILSAVALCTVVIAAAPCSAGTIIKLSLGGDPAADIEYTGGPAGVLSTADDLIPGTTGDQNTAVEFVDFMDAFAADIITPTASFTLAGLNADGPALTFGSLVAQNFTDGTFFLYDPANVLLLSGDLDTSSLTGTLGPPGTGGIFTTNFASITDGKLAPYIDPNSVTLSVALANINGGTGLSVIPLPGPPPPPPGFGVGELNAFTADATLNITGDFSGIPEPTSAALCLVAGGLGLIATRRSRR